MNKDLPEFGQRRLRHNKSEPHDIPILILLTGGEKSTTADTIAHLSVIQH